MASILANQIIMIGLLLGIGIWIGKKEIVSYEAARMFSNVAMVVITPIVIMHILQRDLQLELLKAFGLAAVMAAVFHVMAAGVAQFTYRGQSDSTVIDRVMTVGSNSSFMGLPLIGAVLSEEALIYGVAYLVVFNLYLWTGGVMTLRRSVHIKPKELLTNPAILGVLLGFVLFGLKTALRFELPSFLTLTFEAVTQLNTPLPTIVTGVLLANLSLGKLLKDWRIYLVSVMRLVILPLLFLGILLVLRAQNWVSHGSEFILAMMIGCACPCPLTGILMPARLGMDTDRGGALVGVTTILSVGTLPLVVTIANMAMAV